MAETESYSILVVDDDADIRNLLSEFLGRYHYQAVPVANGEEMFAALEKQSFDLVILDIMLPGEDGFTLCKKIRTKSNLPIIMLTAVDEVTDRVVGLEVGADDYLTKPFNPRELLARIRAVLRRHCKHTENSNAGTEITTESERLAFNNWVVELDTRRLFSPEKLEITLSAGEYDLLLAFLYHPKRVLNRDMLLDYTRNRHAEPFDRSIDVQVSRLRQKLEADPKNPVLIKTIRSGGYMFTATVIKS